jgi:pimeloyl-ACP methyl ester carboxylesterase
MQQVHYRYVEVSGRRLFYRQSGNPTDPTLVLLHGFPTSSYMFRRLLPLVAPHYHVIAPDHLGFGLSDAPDVTDFEYTFDALADLTAGLLDELHVRRYAMYVHDYGAPIGWRLALRDPTAITAIVTQNGNAYDAGFVDDFWKMVWAYGADQSKANEHALRGFLTLEATRWQYVTGVSDQTLLDPEAWLHDYALISRPGNDLVQLRLMQDYASNARLYPLLHEYFRATRVPLLAAWGRGDETFSSAGAKAFAEDLPDAEIHLLDAGHFPLESALKESTELIIDFLCRQLSTK